MSERTDQVQSRYGFVWKWSPLHPTKAEIQKMLYSYDELATTALDRLDVLSPPPQSKTWQCPHGGKGQRDVYELVQKHAHEDEVVGKLWDEVSSVPEWVDWDQLARGQAVVRQYYGQIILGLFFRSLIGGMAAWRVVETLSRTGGFGVAVCRRRLLETLQHYLDVVDDLDSIKPGGKGFTSSVRVRLLHASVRRRLMNLEKEKPGYFDVQKWGVPINDLHCIGTVSVYSTAIIYTAFPMQGVRLSEQQIADYLALWRWIGHLLGTPVDWMTSPARAKAMYESIIESEVCPSANSKIIANNILTAETGVEPLRASREYLCAAAHCLNGSELATDLGIDKPGLYHRFLVWLQCYMLLFFSLLYPYMPASLQERRHRRYMRMSYELIMNRKKGGIGEQAKFEFQYVPDIGKMTELGSWRKAVKNGRFETNWVVVACLLAGLVAGAGVVYAHIAAKDDGPGWIGLGSGSLGTSIGAWV